MLNSYRNDQNPGELNYPRKVEANAGPTCREGLRGFYVTSLTHVGPTNVYWSQGRPLTFDAACCEGVRIGDSRLST